MKEVTVWDGKPREMWVWDDGKPPIKAFVVYIEPDAKNYPVFATIITDKGCKSNGLFKHCAEIEKQRRITNKELSRWLNERPGRECKYGDDPHTTVSHFFNYNLDEEDDEVETGYYVREGDEPWHVPLVDGEQE